jgi:excisionase family DNA binding protein
MSQVIVTTKEELEQFIRSAIERAVASISLPSKAIQQEYLNAKQAAEYLGISLPTLYKYSSEGSITLIKKTKQLRFRKSDLDQWLNEGNKRSIRQIEKEIKGEY